MMKKPEIEKNLAYWKGFKDGISNFEEYTEVEINSKIEILEKILEE